MLPEESNAIHIFGKGREKNPFSSLEGLKKAYRQAIQGVVFEGFLDFEKADWTHTNPILTRELEEQIIFSKDGSPDLTKDAIDVIIADKWYKDAIEYELDNGQREAFAAKYREVSEYVDEFD